MSTNTRFNIPKSTLDKHRNMGGVCIFLQTRNDLEIAKNHVSRWYSEKNIQDYLSVKSFTDAEWSILHLEASPSLIAITPNHDTLNLSNLIGENLDKEIALSMIRSPQTYFYPSYDEFFASIRTRRYAAIAASKTQIAFDTEAALRPEDCWTYIEEKGFVLKPNVGLVEAIKKTIHPKENESLYSFSCSRACEHVMLLALTEELEQTNPELLLSIEAMWREEALRSSEFDNAFIQEHGSFENSLPVRFYVPGDRTWFRNPDQYSAYVTGFEGSWVVYQGSGKFSNFWDYTNPTSLEQKCIEMYHWRHGVEKKEDGEYWMNEPLVAEFVKKTVADKKAYDTIVAEMMKLHDSTGVYEDGGFAPHARDEIRWVCRDTNNIRITS